MEIQKGASSKKEGVMRQGLKFLLALLLLCIAVKAFAEDCGCDPQEKRDSKSSASIQPYTP